MLIGDSQDRPLTTMVWDAMRDGLEDYEYFKILEQQSPNDELVVKIMEDWGDFI